MSLTHDRIRMRVMTSKVKVSVLLAFLIALIGPPAFCGEVEDLILKGNQSVQQKDYPKALKEYEQALKLDPKNSKANLLLGLTYANTGELDKAIRYSQISLALEPSFAAHRNLGLVYANKGEYEKARDSYERALKLNPSSYRAWYELGLLHSSHSVFDKAIVCYKKSLELNPRLADAHLGLGSAYYWSGNKTDALDEVRQLKEMKMKDKAAALRNWIQDKDAKKKLTETKTEEPT